MEKEFLKIAIDTYTAILKIPHNEPWRIENQILYVQLRDLIANHSNLTKQEVQEKYESRAVLTASGHIPIADKWTILDIHATDISANMMSKLSKYHSSYIDVNNNEHIYPASIKDSEEEEDLRRIFDEEYTTLEEIMKLCADNDAFYFRIIYS